MIRAPVADRSQAARLRCAGSEQPPQLDKRFPATCLDREERSAGQVGVAEEPRPCLGLHDHDTDPVRDDVVQLARDASAFLDNGGDCALFALALEPARAVAEQRELAATAAKVAADQSREQENEGCAGARTVRLTAATVHEVVRKKDQDGPPPPSTARRSSQLAPTE